VSTAVNIGKLSVESCETPLRVNESSICARLSAESVVNLDTLFAVKLPDILLMPSSAISSVVLVAMAMSPE
jgi:hypothetical protein